MDPYDHLFIRYGCSNREGKIATKGQNRVGRCVCVNLRVRVSERESERVRERFNEH